MVSKEQGNAHFRATMSHAAAEVGLVSSARLGSGLWGASVLRADLSQLLLVKGGLWGLGNSKCSSKVTFFTVFLMLLDMVGDTRGSWKVMVFFIFVSGRVISSVSEWAASLEALNSRIPRQSEVAYENKI